MDLRGTSVKTNQTHVFEIREVKEMAISKLVVFWTEMTIDAIS